MDFFKEIYKNVGQIFGIKSTKQIFTNQSWIDICHYPNDKYLYLFRQDNGHLLFSKNGSVQNWSWNIHLDRKFISLSFGEKNTLYNILALNEFLFILEVDGGNNRIVLINELDIEDWVGLYSNQKEIGDLVEEIKQYPKLRVKQRNAVVTILRNHKKINNKYTYKNLVNAKQYIERKFKIKSTLKAESFLSILVEN